MDPPRSVPILVHSACTSTMSSIQVPSDLVNSAPSGTTLTETAVFGAGVLVPLNKAITHFGASYFYHDSNTEAPSSPAYAPTDAGGPFGPCEDCSDELESRGAVAGTGDACVCSGYDDGYASCDSLSGNRFDVEEDTHIRIVSLASLKVGLRVQRGISLTRDGDNDADADGGGVEDGSGPSSVAKQGVVARKKISKKRKRHIAARERKKKKRLEDHNLVIIVLYLLIFINI